jgi:hypothetical protein
MLLNHVFTLDIAIIMTCCYYTTYTPSVLGTIRSYALLLLFNENVICYQLIHSPHLLVRATNEQSYLQGTFLELF